MFYYTGATKTYTVPNNVISIQVQLWGAGGGGGYYNTNNDISSTTFGGGAGILRYYKNLL